MEYQNKTLMNYRAKMEVQYSATYKRVGELQGENQLTKRKLLHMEEQFMNKSREEHRCRDLIATQSAAMQQFQHQIEDLKTKNLDLSF